MANELEGARTLPVRFIDQGDGSTAERVATVDIPDVLVSKDLSSTTITGDPNAPGSGELIVAVPYGMAGASFRYVSGTGTVVFEASLNGGTTWDALNSARLDATGSAASSSASAGVTYGAAIPAGTTHLRIRASAYTATMTVRLGMTASPFNSSVVTLSSSTVTLAAGTTRIGGVGVAGIWQDTSTTALGAGATFTGTGRDLTATATNTAFASATSYPKEYRAIAVSDVAGTLYHEISRDNTTYRRVLAVAADNTTSGGLYVARLTYLPVTRYCRVVYVNGAGAQAHFTLQELYLAA